MSKEPAQGRFFHMVGSVYSSIHLIILLFSLALSLPGAKKTFSHKTKSPKSVT